jgi:hypothetical protein
MGVAGRICKPLSATLRYNLSAEVGRLFRPGPEWEQLSLTELVPHRAGSFALLAFCAMSFAVSGCSSSSGGGSTNPTSSGNSEAAAAALTAISCANSDLTGAGNDTCTVSLNAVAGGNGLTVAVTSGNTAVAVPATVVVPPTATSIGFTAAVSAVTEAQPVTLTAAAGGVSKTFTLHVNPSAAGVPGLSISTPGLAFGNVGLNTPSTLPVVLSCTGTVPVTIQSATVSGTAFTFSGATFPVTLSPSQALTLDVQFDPVLAGAASGQLTINDDASTGASTTIALSGTGVSGSQGVSHQVSLTWDAPGSSPDPVAGYNIYRASGGSATYQLLNASPDTQTTYVDTTVQGSETYTYYVMSVDTAGTLSTASNQVTATVP